MKGLRATARKTLDLGDIEAVDLAQYDSIRFCHVESGARLDVRVRGNCVIINTDLGRAMTIKLDTSNQFSIDLAPQGDGS